MAGVDKQMVDVALGKRSYRIHIGSGVIDDLAELVSLNDVSQILIVSNETVFPLYGQQLIQSLKAKFSLQIHDCIIADGEEYKSWETARNVLDKCVEYSLDRKSLIIALGGGVVGDLAGFVASIYMRGIEFIQLPTTLLSAVDSSVGGKVAVNHPQSKNAIGSFHQPSAVLMDINVLHSLPEREYIAGLAEVVKYGVIMDADFFAYLELHVSEILAKNTLVLSHIVKRSCELKAQVVQEDEHERSGRRAILNFGHTLGHALEAATRYKTYLHGEAISIGMVYEGQLALRKNESHRDMAWSQKDQERLEKLLMAFGLPVEQNDYHLKDLKPSLFKDKKFVRDQMIFVLPLSLGQAALRDDVNMADLESLGL